MEVKKSSEEFCDECGSVTKHPLFYNIIKLKHLVEEFVLCRECAITLRNELSQ